MQLQRMQQGREAHPHPTTLQRHVTPPHAGTIRQPHSPSSPGLASSFSPVAPTTASPRLGSASSMSAFSSPHHFPPSPLSLSFVPTLTLHPAFHSSPSSPASLRSPTAISLRSTGRPLLHSLSPSPPSPPFSALSPSTLSPSTTRSPSTAPSPSSHSRTSSSPSNLLQPTVAAKAARVPHHNRTVSAPATLQWKQTQTSDAVPVYTALIVLILLILLVLLSTRAG